MGGKERGLKNVVWSAHVCMWHVLCMWHVYVLRMLNVAHRTPTCWCYVHECMWYVHIYGTVSKKMSSRIYVIKFVCICIIITSQWLRPSTSYFQHFILHHFSRVIYILGSCTYSVPVLQHSISYRVQTRHNFL